MILICFLVCTRITISSGIVSHTVWLPLGKLIHLPCRVAPFVQSKSLDEWWRLNKKPEADQNTGTIVWRNKIGQVIHIGEKLSIRVPFLSPSELSMTQVLPRIKQTNDEIEFEESMFVSADDTGESQNILESRMLKSVTCSLVRSQPTVGTQTDLPKTIKSDITNFIFRVYIQPVIVWSYAIPKLKPSSNQMMSDDSTSVMIYEVTKKWCRSKRNPSEQRLTPCKNIFIHHMPQPEMGSLSDAIPMKFYDKEYTELTVTVELATEPLTVLLSPFTEYLSYVHARWKFALDGLIKWNLMARSKGNDFSIPTRIRAICPPGTHPYVSVPPLADIVNISYIMLSEKHQMTDDISAAVLKNWPILCNPCPPGQAPKTPYSFDGCHLCPYGFYLGKTNWPASAGCLPCPDGFTTDRIGATSIQECRLYAGTISKWIVDYFLLISREFEDNILGLKSKSRTTIATLKADESLWTRLSRVRLEIWIFLSLYFLLVIWISVMAVYRLKLYFKLRKLYKKQLRLHLKVAVMGQINLISRIKQRAKRNLINVDELKEISENKEETMERDRDFETH